MLRVNQAYEHSEAMQMELAVNGKTRKRTYPRRDQFGPELVYFSNCVLKDMDPEPSGLEGLLDVHIIQSLFKSAHHGVSIELRDLKRRRRPSLRQQIYRPVATIPAIETNYKRHLDIDDVRIATGGTYEDPGRRVTRETAVSLRVIERRPSAHAARFAFQLAQRRGTQVVSASKYTIQKETDGLFEEVVAEVAREFPRIAHRKELFDSMLAGIIMKPERYQVIVTPNEYGDFLSDMCCGLIGSIALGDSTSYAFDPQTGKVIVAMFDPAGGTAPDIAGQNKANPFAALFALASLLRFVGEVKIAAALRQSVLDCLAAGEKTADVGGSLGTREFTRAVIARLARESARVA